MTIGPRCTTRTDCRSPRHPANKFSGQLANPIKLQVSTFTTQPPKGFGLVQRSRAAKRFSGFRCAVRAPAQRLGRAQGRLGRRGGRAGGNSVGAREQRQHRGLLAPRATVDAGSSRALRLSDHLAAEPALPKGLGKVVATRSGASIDGKRRVFMLDFVGAGEKVDGLRLDLAASAGKISNATLMSNGAVHGLRASFEIDPSDADVIELRLRIMRGDQSGHRNLAVSMDLQLNSALQRSNAPTRPGGMPPEAPLAMPAQDLRYKPATTREPAACRAPCCTRASSWSPSPSASRPTASIKCCRSCASPA